MITIEQVTFKVKPDVAKEAFIKEAEHLNAWAKQQPGFQYLSLSQIEDGDWVHLVWWATHKDAITASEKIMQVESLGPFMAMIVEGSVNLTHRPQLSHAMPEAA